MNRISNYEIILVRSMLRMRITPQYPHQFLLRHFCYIACFGTSFQHAHATDELIKRPRLILTALTHWTFRSLTQHVTVAEWVRKILVQRTNRHKYVRKTLQKSVYEVIEATSVNT